MLWLEERVGKKRHRRGKRNGVVGKGQGWKKGSTRGLEQILGALQASFFGSTFIVSRTLSAQIKRMRNGDREGKLVALTGKP